MRDYRTPPKTSLGEIVTGLRSASAAIHQWAVFATHHDDMAMEQADLYVRLACDLSRAADELNAADMGAYDAEEVA